jgi:serine/threonine protein kinase/tetratricopeptide (TPR) repeat protein
MDPETDSAAKGTHNGIVMSSSSSGIDSNWERLQQLFSQAVELPPEKREEFVKRETADNPELREELLDLLACDSGGNSTGPLTAALGAAIDATTRDRRRAMLGKIVGNYRLTSVLGHGGTGTVYLAERADRQYSAQVAVKIVDSSMPGDLGMRFRAERQILASLNHPNIARLLDAGETDHGQPYLIMEYVHGEPIDRYCDRLQLDLNARLELFLDVCAAVQYAHQNLVVHRDLKPANILVTVEGKPKLLDFGIAKLLDVGEAAAMLALTRMNDRLLTPEYASPEQILGRPVTTASDVYALGVVLYELLTGLRPYVVPASASQLELERSICITDPQRPSAAVRRAIETGPVEGQSNIAAIAIARRTNPDRLQRRLTGDIDAIVMRALRKEPEHRYSSVEQLQADIRRYLSREPVVARQGNWVYYSQRFVRRHAIGVSVSALFLILVLAFAATMSIQRQQIAEERDRATQERARAEKVSNFMLDVFAYAEPFTSEGKEVTARQLLEQAARSIQSDLSEQPEVRARLLESIGKAFRRQGLNERAIAYYEEAMRIREQAELPLDAQTGSLLTELAIALRIQGRFEDADRALAKALEISKSEGNDQSLAGAQLLASLGQLELNRGNLDRASDYLTRSLEVTREVAGPRSTHVAAILIDMANVRSWMDDVDGAERAAREAMSIYRETVDERHPDHVTAKYLLARVLNMQGRTDDAATLYENALTFQKLVFGEDSVRVGHTMTELAQVRLNQNRVDEAEQLMAQSLEISRRVRGESHYTTGYLLSGLAQIHFRQGKLTQAEDEIRRSLDIFAATLPPDHQYVASAEYVMGEILLATGRLPDAEAMLTASMNRWKRTDAPAWRAGRSASALGEVLHRQGRHAEAEKYLVEGFTALSAGRGIDQDTRAKARERIANFYAATNQRQKFEQLQLAVSRGLPPTTAPPN